MCPAICGCSGPMSLPYSFWLSWSTEELAPCARGGSPKLQSVLWAVGSPLQYQVPAAGLLETSESSSSSWCDGSPRCPSIDPPRCILDSHLRRRRCVEWAWFNTHPAIGFPRSYPHPRTFRCDRTRCGGGTCRNKIRRHIHRCWSRLWHNSFFFYFDFESFSPLWSSLADIHVAARGAEMADIERMKKIVPLITCEIPFSQHVCNLVFGVNGTDLNFLDPNQSCQTTNAEQLCGSVKHVALWDFDLW